MKSIFILIGLILSLGCSTKPINNLAVETQEDKVIARADNLTERPEYIKETEPFWVKNGVVYSLGETSLKGSDRVEAGYRIAQTNAKAAIATAIESRLSFIFQGAEEGVGDTNQYRSISAEASELITSSIKPYKRYYEKVASTLDSGERVTKLRVFSVVQIPEADFKTAIFEAIKKRSPSGQLSADFKNKVNQHWDKFVNAEDQEKTK